MKFNTQFEEPNLEAALLGALIIDPIYISEVMNIIVTEKVFTTNVHAIIFVEMQKMYKAGDKVDLYTISTRDQLKQYRGYLVELTNKVDSGVNTISHANVLNSLYAARRVEIFGHELLSKINKIDSNYSEVLQWAQSTIDEINGIATLGDKPRHIKEIVRDSVSQLEERQISLNKGVSIGIPTGLTKLDEVTGGFKGGNLVVIGARPGMGKTALMLKFADAASAAAIPVVIFSLEMSSRELGDRMILGGSKVNSGNYKIGRVSSEDWVAIESTSSEIGKRPIFVKDQANISIQAIKADAQMLKNKGLCGMIIIDYLQLIDTPNNNRYNNRERDIAEITRAAKILAKELDVPVVILAQLSREVDKRTNKTPMLSDLRESGSIEQDADMVLFIHRPEMYGAIHIDTEKYGQIYARGTGVLTIAKQRNGRTGTIYFTHSTDLNRIKDFSMDENVEMI